MKRPVLLPSPLVRSTMTRAAFLFVCVFVTLLAGCGRGADGVLKEAVEVTSQINEVLDGVQSPVDVATAIDKLKSLAQRSRDVADRLEKIVKKDPEEAIAACMNVADDLRNIQRKLRENKRRILASPDLAPQLTPVLEEMDASPLKVPQAE